MPPNPIPRAALNQRWEIMERNYPIPLPRTYSALSPIFPQQDRVLLLILFPTPYIAQKWLEVD